MSQLSRRSVVGALRLTAFLGLALLFGAGSLTAQGTAGKIEGTVRDVSGAPIAGAQVLIVGSAFASTTNEQGYYFINNVPAGVVTVRAQYIGYAPAEARGVRVLAGQTMTVPLQLTPQTVQVEGITVEVVANPIVPRDQVASKPIVSGDVVQALPVSNVTDAIRLQPGVVQSARGLSIRGGRVGEAVTYVDGVPVRSVSGRTSTSTGIGSNLVGTDALEEASITTGAVGASQGDVQSGVISLVTRSGGQRFAPYLRFESDEPAGQTYGQGLNRVEASLSGPLANNLTYFLSTTMEGRQSPQFGKGYENTPLYVMNGVDTTVTIATGAGDSSRVQLPSFTRYSTGQRVPDAWQNDWNLDGKVTYSYGTGSRFSVAYHRTRNQGLNFRGTGGITDPQSQTGFLNLSNQLILNWSQNLSRSSEHALSLDAAFSLQGDQTLGGLVDQAWFANHHTPTGSFSFSDVPFVVNFNNFALDDRLIQNIRVNNCLNGRGPGNATMGGCIPFIGRTQDFSTAVSYRANPYGMPASSFALTGTGNPGVNMAKENRTYGRAALDWQANRYNRVQVGGDFLRSDVRTFNSNLTSQIFMDAAAYKPTRMGLYAQDRVDLGDVVIDLGLRYDRLNSNVMFPRVAGRIFSDPLRNGTAGLAKLVQNNITPTAEDSAVATKCQNAINAADTTAWSTCNLFAAQAHSVLQPSVRVSFPVTDRTGFRLSYAQQAQTPDFRFYASSVNTDLAITNTNSFWGQDISYGKTILFEFGVRHAFTEDMVLDVSAYNKDKVSDVAGRVLPYLDPFYGTTQNIDLFTNQDFGNVRGIDVKLDRRIGSLFQGSVSYTFQSAKSTGSDPTEYLNTYSRQIGNTGERVPPPQAALTTVDNRTHTIAGSLVLNLPQGWHAGSTLGSIFQGFGAFATFRFASGLAYTPFDLGPSGTGCVNLGSGATGPGTGASFGLSSSPCAPLNSFTTPWIKNVDLRLTRGFELSANRNVTVFADFRNLFNFTNVINLFTETGDVRNAVYQSHQVGPQSAAFTNFTGEFGAASTLSLNGNSVSGWDLSDCSAVATSAGQAQVPDCIMMRRVIDRFATDPTAKCTATQCILTTDELQAAYNTWYNRVSGTQTLVGAGMSFRLGFELNF